MKKFNLIFIACLALAYTGCAEDPKVDYCPDNPNKTVPGLCGCSVEDTDSNNNGVPDCFEDKIHHDSEDLCPDDPDKTEPGLCGCGTEDKDSNSDTIPDCIEEKINPQTIDKCPDNPDKTLPGICGCDKPDTDNDNDGIPDCLDKCPDDPEKVLPGICGCDESDELDEITGLPSCLMDEDDLCPGDPDKTDPGVCGCGLADDDTDGDGTLDCFDQCPNDPNKVKPGVCDCGTPDDDLNNDGIPDCLNQCPDTSSKSFPGKCGCDTEDSPENIADDDGDGTINCLDECPNNAFLTKAGENGCEEFDTDGDGVFDSIDTCPYNPNITEGDADCNYVETETGKVFQIWMLHDFERLASEKPGSENVACKPIPEGEENHIYQAGDCCDPETAPLSCASDTQLRTYCSDGIIVQELCPQGCNGTSCKSCSSSANVTSGGEEGACCSPATYIETCNENGTVAKCVNYGVKYVKCEDSCFKMTEDNIKAFCQTPFDENLIEAQVMTDLNFNEYKNNAEAILDWTSIPLDHVHLNGDGHKIIAQKDENRFAINHPVFSDVKDSIISGLSIDFDVSGSPTSFFAENIEHSKINNIQINGSFSASSELEQRSTTAAIMALNTTDSTVNDIEFSGDIDVNGVNFYGLFSNVTDTKFDKLTIKSNSFICKYTNCSSTIGTLNGSSSYSDIIVDIDKWDFQPLAYNIQYGLMASDYGLGGKNVDIHIKNKEIHAPVNYSPILDLMEYMGEMPYSFSYGVTATAYAPIDTLALKVDNFKFDSVYFFGAFGTVGNYSFKNIDIQYPKFIVDLDYETITKLKDWYFYIYTYFFGFAETIYGTLENVKLTVGDLKMPDSLFKKPNSDNYGYYLYVYGFAGSVYNSVHNVNVEYGDVHTGYFYGIGNVNRSTYNPIISDYHFHAKSILAIESVMGAINTFYTGKLLNSTFLIDYMQGNQTGMFNTINYTSYDSVYYYPELTNVAFYGDMYTKSTNSSSFIRSISVHSTQKKYFSTDRVFTASRIQQFTKVDDSGKATDPVVNSALPAIANSMSYTDATSVNGITDLFFLKRGEEKAMPTDNNFTTLVNPIQPTDVPDVVNYLNENIEEDDLKWEIKEITENGETIKIPWLKTE